MYTSFSTIVPRSTLADKFQPHCQSNFQTHVQRLHPQRWSADSHHIVRVQLWVMGQLSDTLIHSFCTLNSGWKAPTTLSECSYKDGVCVGGWYIFQTHTHTHSLLHTIVLQYVYALTHLRSYALTHTTPETVSARKSGHDSIQALSWQR